MTEIRFGGRCEKHLCPKPCTKCAEAGDSSTITVPRATWDAMRQALKDIAEESYDKGAVECANHALTSSNAVSAVPPNAVEKVNAYAEFEGWWEKHGQFCRAGGGEYEKTFAWNAWLYQLVRMSEDAEPSLTAANAVQPQAQGEAVYLVATGETHNGEETYCRYDYPPALSEFERLYTHPQATEPADQEWISVDDQMPPPMERVLAIEPRHRTVKVDMWFGPDFQWSYTHWMPIPAAPEAKQ